jgi:hypothetical protein
VSVPAAVGSIIGALAGLVGFIFFLKLYMIEMDLFMNDFVVYAISGTESAYRRWSGLALGDYTKNRAKILAARTARKRSPAPT